MSDCLRRSLCLCLFLAGKMYNDCNGGIKLQDFAKIVGIPAGDLSLMENFVSSEIFTWRFNVEQEYFFNYKKQVEILFKG
jgi:hypothetical protein